MLRKRTSGETSADLIKKELNAENFPLLKAHICRENLFVRLKGMWIKYAKLNKEFFAYFFQKGLHKTP